MTFSFIHAADLHLGSPFVGLSVRDPEMSKRLVEASREAFTALVDEAIGKRVNFFLVAGDVYDGPWRDTSIGLFYHRELSRLMREGIPVFTVRGNHDADSVVARAIRPPEGAFEFPSDAADTKELAELKVVIHGRSFPAAAVGPDFVASYPLPRAGWFNIGLLHTACNSDLTDRYAPCSLGDLVNKGYQYWALGHLHAYAELHSDPHVVYPGNLQGRGIHECDSKGALLVHVRDGEVQIERLLVDRVRWLEVGVSLEGVRTEDGLHGRLRENFRATLAPTIVEAAERPLIVRVRLHGETTLHGTLSVNRSQWRDEVQSALQENGADIWIEQLKLDTRPLIDVDAVEPGTSGGSVEWVSALQELAVSEELRDVLQAELAEISRKLPAGCVREEFYSAFDGPTLLAEAQDALTERLSSGKRA